MMTASDLKNKNKKHKRASPKSAHPVNKQSWLERLPVELLEQIFLHSLETNMALASPFLCRALSKESIYRVLILFAFFEDDKQHPVEEKHFAPAAYRVLGTEERSRLQEGVLNSRWCTLARVRHCLPTLTRLLAVQEWYRYRERECKQQEDLVSQDGHDQQQQRVSKVPPLDDVSAVNRFFDIDSSVPAIYQYQVEEFLGIAYTHRDISYACYLPNRLVNPVSWHNSTNPNSDNAQPLEFLRLLYNVLGCHLIIDISSLRCGTEFVVRERHYDVLCSVDVPSVCRGIETAVRERNHDALDLLLNIYYLLKNNNTGGQGASTLGQLPIEIIHGATRQGKDSEWILNLLARYTARDGITVPKDDKVLTKWALEQSKAGCRFATWLLEVLGAERADMWALWVEKPEVSYRQAEYPLLHHSSRFSKPSGACLLSEGMCTEITLEKSAMRIHIDHDPLRRIHLTTHFRPQIPSIGVADVCMSCTEKEAS